MQSSKAICHVPPFRQSHMECIHFCAWPIMQHCVYKWKMEGMTHWTWFIATISEILFNDLPKHWLHHSWWTACLLLPCFCSHILKEGVCWCFLKLFTQGWLNVAPVFYMLSQCVCSEWMGIFALSTAHRVNQLRNALMVWLSFSVSHTVCKTSWGRVFVWMVATGMVRGFLVKSSQTPSVSYNTIKCIMET